MRSSSWLRRESTFGRQLKAGLGDGVEQLTLEEKVLEAARVDTGV
jgi:hypothetical protein